MKYGNPKIFFLTFIFFLIGTFSTFAEDKIEVVPLINLEELSPTFEEDKDELESIEDKNIILDKKKFFLANINQRRVIKFILI